VPTHSLEGLIKWLRHDEWRAPFEDTLAEHLEPACEKASITPDEIASVLGEDIVLMLWGCAFEDFLTRHLEDGRNIVEDYLKRRGWKESASNRAYMAALRSSLMSLYEVSEIVPGQSFRARDLIRGGDPVRVSERTATRSLKPWDRIGARIVKVGPDFILGGGVLPFHLDSSEQLLRRLPTCLSQTGGELRALIKQAGPDSGEGGGGQALDDGVLRLAAPVFTTVWLEDALERALQPTLPELRNADGDEILFCTVRWPFAASAQNQTIEAKLDGLSELRKESSTFWNWFRPTKPARKTARTSRSSAGGQTYSVSLEDGSTVLGSIELRDRLVLLTANSLERAERGRDLITSELGELVRAPLIETETPAQALSAQTSDESASRDEADLAPEEEAAIVHAALDQHYRQMLDEPIPMLGGKTPRQAARTKAGRAKVVAWLKYLENGIAQRDPDDPMATYDLSWLWAELGLADQRR
jgi:hypothetical protein